MTQKNKNIILICVAVFIGSYMFRGLIFSTLSLFHARPIVIADPPGHREQPKSPVKETPPFQNLSGPWIGEAQVSGKGFCHLRLELRRNDPAHYAGFTSFICTDVDAIARLKSPVPGELLKTIKPDSAILSGSVENGAIHLKTDKAIGIDANGCSLTEFTVTPFGNSGIAAEWLSGTCPGGNMIMRRQQ